MTGEFYMTVEQIARVCHEANRAYCMSIGDHSQPTWDMAPPWQKESACNGVQAVIDDPDHAPEASHAGWYAEKEAAGWKYGPKKAPDLKEHPCMVPYSDLPPQQKAKDHLFLAVAKSLVCHTIPHKRAAQAKMPELPTTGSSRKKRTRKKAAQLPVGNDSAPAGNGAVSTDPE